jgi:hypothetical protein
MLYYIAAIVILIVITAPAASAEPGKKVKVIEIQNGDLRAVFRDNSQSPEILSGLASLFNIKDAPALNAYDPDNPGASAGVNFEHIISGHSSPHNAFSPRHGDYPMYLLPDGNSVMWHRKAEDEPWKVESTTKITVTAPYYLDIEFRCRPRDASLFAPQSYAVMFWANYMNDVAEVPLHFVGVDKEGGSEKWITADGPEGHKDWNGGGTYRHVDAKSLPYEEGHNFNLNTWSYDYPRFTKPFYYGLASNGMVYMLMFDKGYTPEDEIRFSIFKFKLKDYPRPAWDYQYVIHKVETGKEYGYRARVVWKKFVSPEDCLREYEAWIRCHSEPEKAFERIRGW